MIELEPVGYAITYFAFSLVVTGIAQGKNRSGLGWLLASLFLTPPVALFLLVVFFEKVEDKAKDEE